MRRPTPSRRGMLGGAAALLTGCVSGPGRGLADEGGLQAAAELAIAQASSGFLAWRDGETRIERYAAGWGPERPREVASVAKSFVAVLVAMAAEDGALAGLDQPAAAFIPAWREDARAGITLRHLMSMTSGLDDRGLALRNVAGDQFALNAAAPLRHPPGARWAYNTAAYHLLFHILAAATGETVEAFARRRLFGPLGMDHTRWITSPGTGERGPVVNYYSAVSTARDLARFGRLVLDVGRSEGGRLLGADSLGALLVPSQALNPSYGLLWWLNSRPGKDAFGRGDSLRFPSAPSDTVAALGAGGQMLLVVRSRRLVVVRQGEPPPSPALADELLAAVLRASPGGGGV